MGNHYLDKLAAERLKKYLELPEDTRKELEKNSPRLQVDQQENISYTSSFIEIAKAANKLAKKWNKSIKDVRVEHSCCQDDYSDSYSSELHLGVKGLETDDQYYSRMTTNYESIKSQEEYDRREFDRLKAKFGA